MNNSQTIKGKARTIGFAAGECIIHYSEQQAAADTVRRLDRHKELCGYLTETYEQKNADYGNSFGDMFAELGIITAVTRIGDKYNRIKNLVVHPTPNVKDETIIDTLLDMANYCVMTVIEIERQIEKGGQNK